MTIYRITLGQFTKMAMDSYEYGPKETELGRKALYKKLVQAYDEVDRVDEQIRLVTVMADEAKAIATELVREAVRREVLIEQLKEQLINKTEGETI